MSVRVIDCLGTARLKSMSEESAALLIRLRLSEADRNAAVKRISQGNRERRLSGRNAKRKISYSVAELASEILKRMRGRNARLGMERTRWIAAMGRAQEVATARNVPRGTHATKLAAEAGGERDKSITTPGSTIAHGEVALEMFRSAADWPAVWNPLTQIPVSALKSGTIRNEISLWLKQHFGLYLRNFPASQIGCLFFATVCPYPVVFRAAYGNWSTALLI